MARISVICNTVTIICCTIKTNDHMNINKQQRHQLTLLSMNVAVTNCVLITYSKQNYTLLLFVFYSSTFFPMYQKEYDITEKEMINLHFFKVKSMFF